MMTDAEIEEIEAREQKATPGPWTFEAGDFTGENWMIGSFLCGNSGIDGEDYHVTTDHLHGSQIAGNSDAKTDAEFIAHAREDIPALIAEVRRLKAVLAEYADHDNWDNSTFGLCWKDKWNGLHITRNGYEPAENALKGGK